MFLFSIFAVIFIGNTAFEAGNIAGGSIGIELLFNWKYQDSQAFRLGPLIIGAFAAVLLFIGHYKTLERVLIVLVVGMSLAFMTTAVMTMSNFSDILSGFIPTSPENSFFTIVGLVGTTIVPYNLFLHASSVREKWRGEQDLSAARRDAFVAILVGGLISMSVIIAAGATKGALFNEPADLALALEPIFGASAKYLMGIGLFAAGITSAITAPLAAAYVAKEAFGWDRGLKHPLFKLVWITVLSIGIFFASTGIKPLQIIQFAQFLNGVLLPFIAVVLFWGVNQKRIMGLYINSSAQNIGAALIILFTLFLSFRTFFNLLIE
jgi:Mn2+/Fe2+ NRAMP family transporter